MLQNLKNRIQVLEQESLIEEGALRSAEGSFSNLESLVNHLTSESAILAQVDVAINDLSTRILNQSTGSVDTMLTMGLRFVFDDMDLTFKTAVEKSRGKTAVRFILLQDGQEAPITDSYGGGVIVVAGVLLRVVTIMALKARRFLVLDETLAHVSKQYVPNISKLLNKLCLELGFNILMVTHTEEFSDYAQTHFRVKAGKMGTEIEKVKSLQGASNA